MFIGVHAKKDRAKEKEPQRECKPNVQNEGNV